MRKRKVIAYMAISLDGFIARGNGDIEWLSMANRPGEDYGYNAFYDEIDTVLIGRNTYEKIMSLGIDFPHKKRKCYVISTTLSGVVPDSDIEHYSEDLHKLIEILKNEQNDKHILVDGGAKLINELAKLELIDEWIISIVPMILGSGLRLFEERCPEQRLKLITSKSYDSGLVQLTYSRTH